MPELPEVELARRNLSAWTDGFRIAECILSPKARYDGAFSELNGAVFDGWSRHGKFLTARFVDGQHLVSHLGMTGKWVCDPEGDRKHVHVHLNLESSDLSRVLVFIDPRRFGWNRLRKDHIAASQEIQHLGPDALIDIKSGKQLETHLGNSRSAIWRRMLDQRRLAGIGTILASEICYRAKVHPLRPSNSLNSPEWTQLLDGLRAHVDIVLEKNVGPEIDYLRPGMQTFFLCYGKNDSPCSRCGEGITKDTVAGRPVYWCPDCQSL
jgi:formamidopyrimidine-DNA glycosylase